MIQENASSKRNAKIPKPQGPRKPKSPPEQGPPKP